MFGTLLGKNKNCEDEISQVSAKISKMNLKKKDLEEKNLEVVIMSTR